MQRLQLRHEGAMVKPSSGLPIVKLCAAKVPKRSVGIGEGVKQHEIIDNA
jgi:hypothetical protein